MDEFDISFSQPKQSPAVRRNTDTLRILVIGDYCGSSAAGQALASRKPQALSIDNFDSTMARLAPSAVIQDENESIALSFSKLEDFAPDQLFNHNRLFATLKEQRLAIKSGNYTAVSSDKAESNNKDNADFQTESSADAVSRLLGDSTGSKPPKPTAGLLDAFIKNIASEGNAPHPQGNDAHLAGCDAAIGSLMRRVLHEPAVQALEANWRGLYDLVNSIEDEETTQVCWLHATVAELADDLCNPDKDTSDLVTTLVEQGTGTFGGAGWGYIVLADTVTVNQAAIVAALGAVAKAAGGILLANTSIKSVQEQPPAHWPSLRQFEAADAIHLITPLVLSRAPYGAQNDAPDHFNFEECEGIPEHNELVWGSSALLVATCLAQAFQQGGSRGNLSDQAAAQFRPQFTFERDGIKAMQPVAEEVMSDSQAETLRSEWGVMPIRAEHNGNRLLFVALQTLQSR